MHHISRGIAKNRIGRTAKDLESYRERSFSGNEPRRHKKIHPEIDAGIDFGFFVMIERPFDQLRRNGGFSFTLVTPFLTLLRLRPLRLPDAVRSTGVDNVSAHKLMPQLQFVNGQATLQYLTADTG